MILSRHNDAKELRAGHQGSLLAKHLTIPARIAKLLHSSLARPEEKQSAWPAGALRSRKSAFGKLIQGGVNPLKRLRRGLDRLLYVLFDLIENESPIGL